jgi:hypothetical protein
VRPKWDSQKSQDQASATPMSRIRKAALPQMPYRKRLELARYLAEDGYGVEDLINGLNLCWRDARYIVFGRVD